MDEIQKLQEDITNTFYKTKVFIEGVAIPPYILTKDKLLLLIKGVAIRSSILTEVDPHVSITDKLMFTGTCLTALHTLLLILDTCKKLLKLPSQERNYQIVGSMRYHYIISTQHLNKSNNIIKY
jgi:hypothetical protein